MKVLINNFNEFKHWYQKIVKQFQFDPKADQRARDIIVEILKKKKRQWRPEKVLASFRDVLHQKKAIILYGCGPTLEDTIERLIAAEGKSIFSRFVNLAADGASVLLREKKLPLEGIFTDLDGITRREFAYGNYLIIHSHGDNINKLKQFENQIIEKKNLIATTQVEPKNGVFNPGGFTDGDRILYFIKNLIKSDQTLYLIGMDFKDIVGKYSKPHKKENFSAPQVKRKKLEVAVALIEQFSGEVQNEMYFVNSPRVSDKFKYISLAEFITDHLTNR